MRHEHTEATFASMTSTRRLRHCVAKGDAVLSFQVIFSPLPRKISYRSEKSECKRDERPEKGDASGVAQIKATRRYDQRAALSVVPAEPITRDDYIPDVASAIGRRDKWTCHVAER